MCISAALLLVCALNTNPTNSKTSDVLWGNIDVAEIPDKVKVAISKVRADPSALNEYEAAQLIWMWHAAFELSQKGEVQVKVPKPIISISVMIDYAERASLHGSEEAAPFLADYFSNQDKSDLGRRLASCWDATSSLLPPYGSRFFSTAKKCVSLRVNNN
jgi:hypothetical protein